MQLRLLVVVEAHEEYVAGVVGYLRGIILALDLCNFHARFCEKIISSRFIDAPKVRFSWFYDAN